MSLISFRKNTPTAKRQLDPFYALQTDMNKLFNHFLSEPFGEKSSIGQAVLDAKTDLKETKDEFVLHADLPGFEKQDISVDFEENVLTVKGERRAEEVKDDEKYHHLERSFGSFERRFMVPESLVDSTKISAKFSNGVLTVQLPKKAKGQKDTQKITIH